MHDDQRMTRGSGTPAGSDAEHRRADSLGKLIESMAHALRTPLGTIATSAGFLRFAGSDPAVVAQIAGILERAASAATDLVADMEELARLEAGIDLDLGAIDGEAMVRHVIVETRPAAMLRNVGLRLAPLAGPLRLVGDEARLRQALGRLVAYAVESARADSTVSVFVEVTDAIACFTVEDHGTAIPDDQMPWLFESDGLRAPSRRRGGLGMGLAVAREIARAHGGNLRCDAAEDCTATFRLAIPNVPCA